MKTGRLTGTRKGGTNVELLMFQAPLEGYVFAYYLALKHP